MFDKQKTRAAFSKAALKYDELAILQQQTGAQMLQRLQYIKHNPHLIMDIGAGTGIHTRALNKQYPNAQVIALDFALPMLKKIQKPFRLFNKIQCICADMEALPIKTNALDLIYSNAALQWSNHLEQTFKEWFRVLKPGGLLMFSTFGPSTLFELKQAWQAVEEEQNIQSHVNTFTDLHEIGDLLLKAGFSQAVMDIEKTILTYPTVKDLMYDLKGIGANNTQANRRKTLTGKQRLKKMSEYYERFRQDGVLPASYEIIYGHAWIPQKTTQQYSPRVPVQSILQ